MSSKKFFHDRMVLLLVSVNTSLAILSAFALLLRLSTNQSVSYVIRYRPNLGLSGFDPGTASSFTSFLVFLALVLGFHTFLGRKVYHIRRQLSIVVLSLGTLLIVLTAIVSNALLGIS